MNKFIFYIIILLIYVFVYLFYLLVLKILGKIKKENNKKIPREGLREFFPRVCTTITERAPMRMSHPRGARGTQSTCHIECKCRHLGGNALPLDRRAATICVAQLRSPSHRHIAIVPLAVC